MAEKRKIRQSTRRHGESPLKKRMYSSSPPPTQIEIVEEGLPYRLKDNHDLPILSEPQDKNLCSVEYQSIAESGVLIASLDRSRQKWLTDGIFDRYWAKPSKKRTSIDSQNPAKESMTKLGVCSMIIEPHVFETTLYTVKEPQFNYPSPKLPPPQSQPDMRYSSFSHVAIYPLASNSTSTAESTLPKHREQRPSQSQLTLPPFREGFAHYGPRDPAFHSPPLVPERIMDTNGTNGTRRDAFQVQDDKPNADPVIQMLATRAASNHDLKSLMKVVASGNASQSQLRDFQDHIDELNNILKTRNEPSSHPQQGRKENLPSIFSGSESQISDQILVSTSTLSIGHTPNAVASPAPSKPVGEAIKQEPLPQYFSHYTQTSKPKSAVSHKSDISAIVFDLGGSGDRFSFPKFSILEYLPGGTQVVVSFLIIRRGSAAVSKAYKGTTNYYQPVTIRLSSSHPRLLEPLARIVAPPDEVRRYMNSIFDKMSAAENVFLATQLPRFKDSILNDKEDTSVHLKPDHTRATHSPPNALVPLQA